MRLEHFHLRGFAQHDTLELRFLHDKPNLIIGPNEVGKSHLMAALTGTIFGIERPDTYTPWRGDPEMTGRLTFTTDGNRVEIERRFLEQQVDVTVDGAHIYSGRGLVYRNTAEDQRYRSLLHEWVGFSDHDVFLRTVFVGQDQVQDRHLGDLSAQFKRLISGTREANYETAIHDLERQLDTLIKLPGKRTNRRREELLDHLRDLEARHHQAELVQQQLVSLIEDESALRESLQNAIETRDRIQRLIDRYGELQDEIAKENQHRLAWYDLQDQVKRLNRINQQREEQEAKRDQLRIPGTPGPVEISAIARDIDRLESQVEHLNDAAERNRELRKNREFLTQELERLRIPGGVEAPDVREIGLQLQHSEQIVGERQRELEEALREAEIDKQRPGGLRHAMFTLAATILIGSAALGFLVNPLFAAGAVLALIVAMTGYVLDQRNRSHPPTNDPHVLQVQRRRQELQSAIDTLQKYQADRNKLLAASGVRTLHDLFDQAREYHGTEMRLQALPEVDDQPERELPKTRDELRRLKARRDHLLRVSGEPDLDALYRRAAEYGEIVRFVDRMETVDQEYLQSLVTRMDAAQQDTVVSRRARQMLLREFPELNGMSAEQVDEYRQAVEDASNSQEEIDRTLYQVQLDREQLGRGSEDAEELRLQTAEVREQLGLVERQAEAHQLAIETLRASVQAFQERALDPVADQAGTHMSRITDGRYQHVELAPDSMTPTVSGNGQSGISLDQLSRGARDQLYLSIRAALIDALSGDRNLPMLLDDPCVNFDEERLGGAAHLLSALARERQILVFTKDEAWTRWFDPILRLER